MELDLFGFSDYKAYLNSWLSNYSENHGRGGKSALAKAARCQLAYISQILNHEAELSLEQAESIAALLGFTAEETIFFLLLVQAQRASTPPLKRLFRSQISKIKSGRLMLKNRLNVDSVLTDADKFTYYSSWHYAAVHVLVGIPACRNKEAISDHLRLPPARVGDVLAFLQAKGLIRNDGGGYSPAKISMHLSGDAVMISAHHGNCRALAARAAELFDENNLQYSSLVTLSREDAAKIRSLLIDAIQRNKDIIKKSDDETLHCFNIDFFEVK